jgi:hypothetical protein
MDICQRSTAAVTGDRSSLIGGASHQIALPVDMHNFNPSPIAGYFPY